MIAAVCQVKVCYAVVTGKYYETYRAIETLSVVDATHGFKVFITGFDWKLAAGAFRLKHTSIIYTVPKSLASRG